MTCSQELLKNTQLLLTCCFRGRKFLTKNDFMQVGENRARLQREVMILNDTDKVSQKNTF